MMHRYIDFTCASQGIIIRVAAIAGMINGGVDR